MTTMRLSWIALIAVLTACGGSVSGSDNSVTGSGSLPPSTVSGVGILPATIPAAPPSEFESLVTRPLTADGEIAEPIGDQVAGNRLLMIGDSILASTETRYGGEMCATLEPLGWAVEVAAEAGRFVEFGVSVVNQRVPRPSADQSRRCRRKHLAFDGPFARRCNRLGCCSRVSRKQLRRRQRELRHKDARDSGSAGATSDAFVHCDGVSPQLLRRHSGHQRPCHRIPECHADRLGSSSSDTRRAPSRWPSPQ